ncbi:MAG: hypothetical protein ACREWG_06115 [Gammaproteobacteria bacterium]
MLRGGSWNNHSDHARADNRNRNHPNNRNNNAGFRVVSSVHVVPDRHSPGLADQGRPDAAGTGAMARVHPVRMPWHRAYIKSAAPPGFVPVAPFFFSRTPGFSTIRRANDRSRQPGG